MDQHRQDGQEDPGQGGVSPGRHSRRTLLKLGGSAALGAAAVAAAAAVTSGRHPARAAAPGPYYDVVADFGADSSGTNDATPSIQAAINAASGSNGGTVFFRPGIYQCDGQLNADQSRGIWLVGSGGETAGANPGTELRFSGGGPSFISARSTAGFAIQRLGIYYTNPAFAGFVVDFAGGQANQWDTAFGLVTDCVFSPAGGQPTAAAIINLDRAIDSTIRNCNLVGAQHAIVGVATAGHYSNAIQVESSRFGGTVGEAIWNPGEAWLIHGCTFEQRTDGSAGAINCGLPAKGLVINGCWLGDVTASSPSTQVIFRGSALLVEGCMVGGRPSTTGIAVAGAGNVGIDIRGNHFENHAVGVDLGTGVSAVMVVDNQFNNVATRVAGNVPPNGIVQNAKGFAIGVGQALSALQVNGALTVGATDSAFAGAGQIIPGNASPVSLRQTFTGDRTGWQWRLAVNLHGAHGNGIVDLVTVDDKGNMGIGVTNPTYRLQLDVDQAAKPGTSVWTVLSDSGVKDPASIADFRDGLDVVRQLRPVHYRYNGKAGLPTDDQIGVIAQEVAPVMPYSIKQMRTRLEPTDAEETELLGFNSHALSFVLVNAVRELEAGLREGMGRLEERLQRLEADKKVDYLS